MPKRRSIVDIPTEGRTPAKRIHKHEGESGVNQSITDEMGEFEDPWEDEIESDEGERDEEHVDDDGDDDSHAEAMDVDSDHDGLDRIDEEEQIDDTKPFLLGVDEVPEGFTLEADDSVYTMRHNLSLGWACYSFDILRDNMGDERHRLPTSAYIIGGSQINQAEDNTVLVAKMSSLHRTQTHDDSDEESDENEDTLDEDPILEERSIPHMGIVNRIRAQRLATPILPPVNSPYYAASFADTGKVHVYNVRPLIESLETPSYSLDANSRKPAFTISSHKTEGYAMDWNAPTASSLSLITGDDDAKIYLTTAANADFRPNSQPFHSHLGSVQDLQWSPTEITVFASCSIDRSIRMWDIRSRGRQSITSIVEAHRSDVNVISWNRSTSYLLLSGDDNGEIKVWDLRNIKEAQPHVAQYNWHKSPIVSIEWNPVDDSVFAASSDDQQITIWDLAVEPDEDLESASNVPDLPPQLLFLHHHERVKEMHWHPQIPDTIISAGFSMLNVFKPVMR